MLASGFAPVLHDNRDEPRAARASTPICRGNPNRETLFFIPGNNTSFQSLVRLFPNLPIDIFQGLVYK